MAAPTSETITTGPPRYTTIGDSTRLTLDAILAGIPVLLPPALEPVYGEAARYVEPGGIDRAIEEVSHPVVRGDLRLRALDHLRALHPPEQFVDTVMGLFPDLGDELPAEMADPAPLPLAAEPVRDVTADHESATHTTHEGQAHRYETQPDDDPPTVLFMSTNGNGMGHLTRLLAYATATGPAINGTFLSLSEAFSTVNQFGYSVEYLPSADRLRMPHRAWRRTLVDRMNQLLEIHQPDVLVFDGTFPYGGMDQVRASHRDMKWIWSRRGMWLPGKGGHGLERARLFDTVVEPGDLAREADGGATRSAEAELIRPVTLMQPSDLVPRDQARRELGLPPDEPVALISLGSGNLKDFSAGLGAAVEACRRLGVTPCLTKNALAKSVGTQGMGLLNVERYPLSTHFNAFDFSVSAAGYNSFHESLRLGTPVVFVPNERSLLDDQVARARYAAEKGWAHMTEEASADRLTPLMEDLLHHGETFVARGQAADPGNGAEDMAKIILREAHS